MRPFISETDADCLAVLHHGGANGGDEDFALIRCLNCGRVYLVDSEVDTLFLDAADLSRRAGFFYESNAVPCASCGKPLRATDLWAALRGDEDTEMWRVPWVVVAASPWAWAVKPHPGPAGGPTE